jgi:phosphatidylglycerophosphatase C
LSLDLALFDFDGTLTTRETFPDFLDHAVPRWRLRLGKVVLAPLVLGYRLGLVSGVLIRAVIVWFGFRGVDAETVGAQGRDFALTVLPGLLRPEAMARLRWHQARGDTVVSGGLELYLRPWCEAQGIACLGSVLARRGKALTGGYDGAQCVRAEKARRVRAAYDLSRFDHVHAYGDTPEDHELLALAHTRVYRGRVVSAFS